VARRTFDPLTNWKSFWASALILLCVLARCLADQALKPGPELLVSAASESSGFVVMPSPTNAIQLRLYTSASPDSPHLFNTFDIEAYGERLLQSPRGDAFKRSLTASPTNAWLHNILVDGEGPTLVSTNSMAVIEQASGPAWRYLALDASAAYRGRLEQYKRGILFVAPDLFVLFDHLVAKKPASFQMLLHPPAATQVDDIWRDLRLDLPKAGFRIHAPGAKRTPRSWVRIESAADQLLPGTVTMQLGPTNKFVALDLVTVFAVYRGGEKKSYAFKLLESNSAIGARIHRDGWPTLVAFKIDAAAQSASLTGFSFSGPVGVDVFKPKQRGR
jgi:hypothetical protein